MLYLIFFLPIYAQQSVEKDVIFLKSGEKYSGIIVLKTDKMLMLKMDDGQRFQFELSNIEKIKKEIPVIQEQKSENNAYNSTDIVERIGVCGGLETIKRGINTSPFAGMSLAIGTKDAFNSNTFLGVGTGYETNFATQNNEKISFVPLFIEVNHSFLDKNFTPALDLKIGHKFSLQQSYKGGLFIAVSGGINLKSAYYIGLFIDLQKTYGNVTETFSMGDFTSSSNTIIYKYGINGSIKF